MWLPWKTSLSLLSGSIISFDQSIIFPLSACSLLSFEPSAEMGSNDPRSAAQSPLPLASPEALGADDQETIGI